MKRIMAGLLGLALLACAPLHAGEAEQENAKEFLKGLTGLKDAAKCESEVKIRMLGISVGSATLKIEHGEHEGTKCYVVTMTADFKLGDIANKVTSKSHIGADMTLLLEESQETEDGEVRKSKTYKYVDGSIEVTLIDKNKKENQERSYTVKGGPGLMLGATSMVAQLLLPRDAGKKYEFQDWDSTANEHFSVTFEVVGEEELYGQKTVKIVEHGKNYKKAGDSYAAEDTVETQWLAGSKMVRYESAEGFAMDTGPDPKRTAVSKESIEKQDKELHAPILFFMAVLTGSEEIVKKAVNIERFTDNVIDNNEQWAGLTAEERADLKAMIMPGLPAEFVKRAGDSGKSETERKREAAVTDLLKYEEHFVITKDDVKTVVSFSEEVQKLFGKLSFWVEKNKDNKWQVTWVVNDSESDSTPDDE
jgi:hypothetical protein